MVGLLMVKLAPELIVWVVPLKEIEAPEFWFSMVTLPGPATSVAALSVWLPVKFNALTPPADIRIELIAEVPVVLVAEIVPVPLTERAAVDVT